MNDEIEGELASAFNDGVKNAEEGYEKPGIITITVYNSKDKHKNEILTEMWCAGAGYAHIVQRGSDGDRI